ncbi:MAG: DUF952 domain-containing protein [Chloroflexota bacterium]|nr:MAG: DUF952 domain-containing protein [Chloroflexota bacterium]
MALILHITTVDAWDEARSIGLYKGDTLQTQGFIHFSRPDQILQVANNFYAGRNDLVLLVVDTKRLTSELRWEAPVHAGGNGPKADEAEDLYPHLYGPLNVDAVIRVVDFKPGPDGTFSSLDIL